MGAECQETRQRGSGEASGVGGQRRCAWERAGGASAASLRGGDKAQRYIQEQQYKGGGGVLWGLGCSSGASLVVLHAPPLCAAARYLDCCKRRPSGHSAQGGELLQVRLGGLLHTLYTAPESL